MIFALTTSVLQRSFYLLVEKTSRSGNFKLSGSSHSSHFLVVLCTALAVLKQKGIIGVATFFRSKWETAMPMQSEFVKNVHLNTVKTMSQHGMHPQKIVEHLKSVSCDDDDIGELMQAIKPELYQGSTSQLKP